MMRPTMNGGLMRKTRPTRTGSRGITVLAINLIAAGSRWRGVTPVKSLRIATPRLRERGRHQGEGAAGAGRQSGGRPQPTGACAQQRRHVRTSAREAQGASRFDRRGDVLLCVDIVQRVEHARRDHPCHILRRPILRLVIPQPNPHERAALVVRAARH
eukprot:4673937-Prymnesium_polylepis.1